MATRLAFYAKNNKIYSQAVNFEWMPGLSAAQKKRSMANMHRVINGKALEVSTKSDKEIGVKLSAFNLRLNGVPLENIFQSSKCFAAGGPYKDLLAVSPKEAKRDERLKHSGLLKSFEFENESWDLEPKTAFYDYIYVRAVKESVPLEELKQILEYDYFTDIEFNHAKSLNTQARSIGIVKVLLQIFGEIPDVRSKEEFLKFHKTVVKA